MNSKKIWLIILGVSLSAMLAIYIIAGLNYMDQQSQHQDVSAEIDQLSPSLDNGAKLQQVKNETAEIQKQLTEARQKLTEASTPVNVGLDGMDILNAIVDLARQSTLDSYEIGALPSSSEVIGQHEYSVLRYSCQATALPENIAGFISQLVNGNLKTIAIEKASLALNDENWTINMELFVYANPIPV